MSARDKTCIKKLFIFILFFASLSIPFSCKKFLEIPAPITKVTSANVYTNAETAASVLTNIYANLSATNQNLFSDGLSSISLLSALSGDELVLYNLNDATLFPFYTNDLTNSTIPNFWNGSYSALFAINAAIEGLSATTSLTPSVKNQLLGEAKFMRAFYLFYLTNLYGDIPLTISTDYKLNAKLSRSAQTAVMTQIVLDLQQAQGLLSDMYLSGDVQTSTEERVRPTKWAATALLSRAYLYEKSYKQAAEEATKLIDHSSLYNLTTLNEVFLKNSSEAIWQLQPVGKFESSNTGDGATFVLPSDGPNNIFNPVYLSTNLLNDFEPADQRKNNWVDSVTANGLTYYYPFKYKIGRVNTPTVEYIMVLRLGEQYLIRAEARAQSGDLNGAVADVNVIRNRARLPNLSGIDPNKIVDIIAHERKVELFTEWGHRWLDLKRLNKIDAVMAIATPKKGGAWKSSAKLYAIPLSELEKNKNLVQNPGY